MSGPVEILSSVATCQSVIKNYSLRQQQVDMVEAIVNAFENHESLICEAGTGTGKTFAYLLPAILSGKKVIVSTGTKHLQDQVYKKDLPVMLKLVDKPLSTAILKGRANYLCQFRFNQLKNDPGLISRDNIGYFHAVQDWSLQTERGDLSEIENLPENSAFHSQLNSTTENCLGQECDYFEECYVFRARKKASEADLIITNHHIVFADLALKDVGYGEILPSVDTIIFDEAHHLPKLASEFFSETLSYSNIAELIKDSRAAYLKDANDMPEFLEHMDGIETSLKKFRLSFAKGEKRISWADVADNNIIQTAKKTLVKSIQITEKILDQLSSRSKQLNNCWQRCSQILDFVESFGDRENDQMIQWLELSKYGFTFYQTPLNISENFQSRLTPHDCHCVYTSATLAVGDDFSHFSAQLGLNDIHAVSFDSPFDYSRQSLLYLPDDMPLPGEKGYTEKVVAAAIPVLELTQGNAFILFTSYQALNIAENLIREHLDYPVLVQGDTPRTELLEHFRRTDNAVLLGTSSFWEGVDVRGTALSCVIIDKLPFATPDDPVFKARAAKMEAAGINPFIQYQLPEAIIALRQGIGRLIRDVNDYGVLMICDPRIKNRSYGKKFLNNLPQMTITNELSRIEDFIKKCRSN